MRDSASRMQAKKSGEFFRPGPGGWVIEKVAKAKSSTTGKLLSGIAQYQPVLDVLGRPVEDRDFDLNLITHREIFATKSRTISNYWLLSVMPENAILMNRKDAEARGLKDGDQVRVISASNPDGVWDLRNGRKVPVVGQVKVIEGIRPGVITFALGWGHWAYGSSDITVDGKRVRGDARRARGIHANAAMRLDDYLKNTCLVDPVGGSVVFYDTRVRVIRA
jgi:tetrathionate reductase subunit A